MSSEKSDGSSADYYKLPPGSNQLQDLISHRDMNAQMGEIFRACYRYGQASHSDKMRDAKKIKFYIEAEIARLSKLNQATDGGPNPVYMGTLAPACKHMIRMDMDCIECGRYNGIQAREFKTGFCGHGVENWMNCVHCQAGDPKLIKTFVGIYCNECKSFNCLHASPEVKTNGRT